MSPPAVRRRRCRAGRRTGSRQVLELENVTKSFRTRRGEVTVFQPVSLRMSAGETLAFLGPSGCGKSTLLRIVAGLTDATTGSVRVHGTESRGVPLDLAMLPQDYNQALLPWRSVLGNVLLPFDAKRRRRAAGANPGRVDLERDARAYLEQVGLAEFVGARPAELSGGMRQRVLIARALMTRASLVLMDEPFSALDAITRLTSQDLVRSVLRGAEPALSAILVTHDVDEAIYMSDRIVVLSDRPARVALDVRVDLPSERDQVSTRRSPAFLDLRATLLSATGTGREPVLPTEPEQA